MRIRETIKCEAFIDKMSSLLFQVIKNLVMLRASTAIKHITISFFTISNEYWRDRI